MDISVSRLNGRLASKLPPELPLGLVFVVGKVSQVAEQRFTLVEGVHQLQCQAGDEHGLKVGDEVRASGHLMFDSEQLQYYLLARDIEVTSTESFAALAGNSRELLAESEDLLSALAAVKARAAVAPEAPANEIPIWVKKLAPPEMQPDAMGDNGEGEEPVTAAPAKRGVVLDDELVTLLSEAMDSEEDLELTPEILAPYHVETTESAELAEEIEREDDRMGTAVPTDPTSYRPRNREDTDWLVILLIISFFVLTIAVIVTVILLILQ